MSSRRESISRRWPALLVLLLVVVAAGFVDHSFGRPKAAVRTTAGSMPVAPPARALSSTWYCAGGTSTSGGSVPVPTARRPHPRRAVATRRANSRTAFSVTNCPTTVSDFL